MWKNGRKNLLWYGRRDKHIKASRSRVVRVGFFCKLIGRLWCGSVCDSYIKINDALWHIARRRKHRHNITLLPWRKKKECRSCLSYFPYDRVALQASARPWSTNDWPHRGNMSTKVLPFAKFNFVFWFFRWHLWQRWTVARINENRFIYYRNDNGTIGLRERSRRRTIYHCEKFSWFSVEHIFEHELQCLRMEMDPIERMHEIYRKTNDILGKKNRCLVLRTCEESEIVKH